jgi:amino acid transporter
MAESSLDEKTHVDGVPERSSENHAGVTYDASEALESDDNLTALGYTPELRRNRSLFTLLFQSLAIAAIPYGEGGPLISAIYGGGQLSIFVGWVVVLILDECVALSLSELASRYPTSAGPYYWSFQIAVGIVFFYVESLLPSMPPNYFFGVSILSPVVP